MSVQPRARRARGVLALALASIASVAATALAQEWRHTPDAARFARPGAPEVTLVLRGAGPGACGGGGCTTEVSVRRVRGRLPSRELSYYYSDRAGPEPGCFPQPEELLAEWTEAVVAPIRGGAEDRPPCGIVAMDGDTPRYFVILKVRPSAP